MIELGRYHVCEVDGAVTGSLLVIEEWSDWRNGAVWWIHSLYLQPQVRGRGLFTDFYGYIKSLVEADARVLGLRLCVDRSNHHAQNVYRKMGMNCDHYQLFEWMKTF